MMDEMERAAEAGSGVRYTETVVDYTDNRKQKALMGLLALVLFVLLLGLAYGVYRLAPGKGAPTGAGDLPAGLKWVRSIYGWGNGPQEQLVAPTDVAVAGDGTIWAVSGHDTLAAFRPDGTAKLVVKPEKVGSLEGIAVGDDGIVYVTDFGGQLLAFDGKGKQVDSWKVQLPQEVDVRDGKIAVSSESGMAVFTSEGKMIMKLGGQRGWGKDQFDLPHGIVIGDDGSVYVSDTQNRRVKAISKSGRVLWVLGDAADRATPGVADVRSNAEALGKSPFLLPSGATIDGRGRLVVVDPFKFRIAVIDPKTGKVVRERRVDGKPGKSAFYGEQGKADGFFAYPTGIDYDATRDWFVVADTYNNRLQIVRIPGSGGNVVNQLIGGFRTPMCLFFIPWILLLVAAAFAIRRRKQRAGAAAAGSAGPDAGAQTV